MSRPSSDERKSIILDAVVAVIIDVGFTEMTVGDVAKRAGVSTSLVHYHFSSKADLIAAALRVASDEDKARREAVAAAQEPALARIENLLCGSLPEGPNDASWLLWIESWGETRRSAAILEVMMDLDSHEAKILRSLVEEGIRAHEFACADPNAAIQRLSAMREGLAVRQTLFDTESSGQHSAELLGEAIRLNLEAT